MNTAAKLLGFLMVLAAMDGYQWPGNVRELKNTVDRLALMHKGTLVQVDDLPKDIQAERASEDEGFQIPFLGCPWMK